MSTNTNCIYRLNNKSCGDAMHEYFTNWISLRNGKYTNYAITGCEQMPEKTTGKNAERLAVAKHTDKTPQAQSYVAELVNVHSANNYHYMDAAVYKDGATILYRNTATNEGTYSFKVANEWYKDGTMIFIFRDCNRTAFAIANPSKSLTRKMKGNGNVKYLRVKKGDELIRF